MQNNSKLNKRHYLLLIHPLALSEDFIQGFGVPVSVLEQTASTASIKNSVTYNDVTVVKTYHAERVTHYLKERHNICVIPNPNNYKNDPVVYNQLKLFYDDPNIEIYTTAKETPEFTMGDFDKLKEII